MPPLVTATAIECLFVALNRPLLLLTDLSSPSIADELSTILMSLGCTQKDVKHFIDGNIEKLVIKRFVDSLNKNFPSRPFHFESWLRRSRFFALHCLIRQSQLQQQKSFYRLRGLIKNSLIFFWGR